MTVLLSRPQENTTRKKEKPFGPPTHLHKASTRPHHPLPPHTHTFTNLHFANHKRQDMNAPSGIQHTKNCRVINDSDWRKLHAEDERRTLYNKHLLELTSRNMTYDTFCETVVCAGRKTAVSTERKCKGWHKPCQETIPPVSSTKESESKSESEDSESTTDNDSSNSVTSTRNRPPLPSHLSYTLPPPKSSLHPRTMPLQHVLTYQAFSKITNFLRNNGDD